MKKKEEAKVAEGFVWKDRGKWDFNVLIYFRLLGFLTHLPRYSGRAGCMTMPRTRICVDDDDDDVDCTLFLATASMTVCFIGVVRSTYVVTLYCNKNNRSNM